MGDLEKPSGPWGSRDRKHIKHGITDEREFSRSNNWNGRPGASDDDASLEDLRRGRASSSDTRDPSRGTRSASPSSASSRRDDTKRRNQYDGYDEHAYEPHDGRSVPSRTARESRESERNFSHGSGAARSGTGDRSRSHSTYRDGTGPASWDDADWHAQMGDPEDADRGRRSGEGRRANNSQARSRYRDYDDYDDYNDPDERYIGGASGEQRRRSTRARADDARTIPLDERLGRSSRIDQWRDFTGRLFAAPRDTSGEHSTLRKGLLSTRRRIILASVAAIIVLCTVISVPVGIVSASQSLSLARDGYNHLKNAENSLKLVGKNPFDTASIQSARTEFVAAHNDFVQVSGRLGLIPGVVDVVPIAGSKLSGARHLMPIAIGGTQAAIIACDALNLVVSSLKDPLNPKASGLSRQNYAALQADWVQIRQIFGTLVDQINALQPSDLTLDPRLGPAIQSFRDAMPKIQQAVQSVDVLVQLLPQLVGIGQPSNFLVEVLDSTELRPGGGFIGNYGFLTLNGGRLAGLHIQDVDLLDVGVKHGNHVISVPDQYAWFKSIFGKYDPRWGFRDSNLDADFPTVAQNAENLYLAEAGDLATETQYFTRKPVPVVGVISLTPWLIQNALRITGPVYIGDIYKETVTADNIIARIHYYALKNTYGSDTTVNSAAGTSDRKRFTGFLFQAFMDKMKTSLSGKMSQFAKLLTDSLHSKDIEIYLNDPKAEGVLHQYGLASMIEAPTTGDSVFKVDANIGGNKSNYILKYDMSDSVTIDASGTATHHLTFKYIWPSDPNTLQETYPADGAPGYIYHSYTRVYVPPSAAIQPSGWERQSISKAFGREVYGGDVRSSFYDHNGTSTFTLTWKVPKAATHDATGWHYHLLFQKQAGITSPLTLQIALPSCATMLAHSDLLKANGTKQVIFKDPLVNDLNLSIDYSC